MKELSMVEVIPLRLNKLILSNFRCFKSCTIDFHPKLTVLVAENSQGKSAILDAVGLALNVFVEAIANEGSAQGFDRASIHIDWGSNAEEKLPSLPTEFHAEGYVDNSAITWSRAVTKYAVRPRSSTKDTAKICAAASNLRNRAFNFDPNSAELPPLLPVVAYYRTDRLWGDSRNAESRKTRQPSGSERFSAYFDCLSSSSSFKSFVAWYERAFNELRSPHSKAHGRENRLELQIAAVQEAVRVALEPTGWTCIAWEFPRIGIDGRLESAGFVVVEHPTRGRFPLSLLSDGVKNMIALVADLAYRCVRLNAHLGESAARLTPGIVMIDEVDMHLHPSWQQVVVGLLQDAFPSMQFVLTTHSPQVLSTVDAESIRLIRLESGAATISRPQFQTRGVESADILARLMDVNPVPIVEQSGWLSEYRAMLQTDDYLSGHGYDLLAKIIEHFGVEHPVLVEINTLRRLQEFKRANNIHPENISSNAKA